MPKRLPQCEFVALKNKNRCLNRAYEGNLCKLHGKGEFSHVKKVKDLGIYIHGLYKEEQDLYEDITTGNLKHEIKIAKLQLRRLLIEQMKFGSSPEDIKNMIATDLSMKDVLIQNGKLVTTSGLPVDLCSSLAETVPLVKGEAQIIPAALVESQLSMTRPNFAADIERMLKIIMQLERVHFEMMGGSSDDPDLLAKQVYEAICQIEENAMGNNATN